MCMVSYFRYCLELDAVQGYLMDYNIWRLTNLNLSDTAALLPCQILNFLLNLAIDSSLAHLQQHQPSQQLVLYLYLSQLRRYLLTSIVHHFIEWKTLKYLFFLPKNNSFDDLYQQYVWSVMDSCWCNSGGCFQSFWQGMISKNIYFTRDLTKPIFSCPYIAS